MNRAMGELAGRLYCERRTKRFHWTEGVIKGEKMSRVEEENIPEISSLCQPLMNRH